MEIVKHKKLSRACFVTGCKTGYSCRSRSRKEEHETKHPSLFKAPEDPVVLHQWQQAIPRGDKVLCSSNVVCSMHFCEEDILRYYETRLADGTINRIQRGRPRLKEGSVPSIFPCLSSYSPTKNVQKREAPHALGYPSVIKKRKSLPSPRLFANSISSNDNETLDHSFTEIAHNEVNVDTSVEANVNSYLFEELKHNLNTITTPNKQWSGTFVPGKNEIIFAEWDDSYTPKNIIIIKRDMSFKVLFGKYEIKLERMGRLITTVTELENIMELINSKGVCS